MHKEDDNLRYWVDNVDTETLINQYKYDIEFLYDIRFHDEISEYRKKRIKSIENKIREVFSKHFDPMKTYKRAVLGNLVTQLDKVD